MLVHRQNSMTSLPEKQIFIQGEAEMCRLGARIACLLRDGDIIALYGDLGMGKTTLARGIIQTAMESDEDIPSPTYTIVQTYTVPDITIWHYDLYRLEAPDELIETGYEEALEDIILMEWPERAGRFLPSDRLSIKIMPEGDGRRLVFLPGSQDWANRIAGCLDDE